MIEQFAAQVEEEENGYNDGCDILPSGKAFARFLILVWDFFPFPAFFRCGDVLSSPPSHPSISPIVDTRVTERRTQDKVEGSTISASTLQLPCYAGGS